jgi:hypothetical protein
VELSELSEGAWFRVAGTERLGMVMHQGPMAVQVMYQGERRRRFVSRGDSEHPAREETFFIPREVVLIGGSTEVTRAEPPEGVA